jgi:hypothetical protein
VVTGARLGNWRLIGGRWTERDGRWQATFAQESWLTGFLGQQRVMRRILSLRGDEARRAGESELGASYIGWARRQDRQVMESGRGPGSPVTRGVIWIYWGA